MDKSRVYWVDFAKFMAILGVMTDHCRGILYTSDSVQYLSFYSVSVFIIMMGITTYWSYRNYDGNNIDKVKLKLIRIFRPYLVATFIYCCLRLSFEFDTFINRLVHFNASGPLYYVFLYIQLLIIAPVLIRIIPKNVCVWGLQELLFLVIIIFVSWIATNYTNIMNIYGGGGKLLGGTYLILLYIGMLMGKYIPKVNMNKIYDFIFFVVIIMLTVLCAYFIAGDKLHFDRFFPFGEGKNPPGVSLMVYSIFITVAVYFIWRLILNYKLVSRVFSAVSKIGKHTLYIFLYHSLIRDLIIYSHVVIDNIWLKRLIFIGLMIIGSIILELLFKCVYTFLLRCYWKSI